MIKLLIVKTKNYFKYGHLISYLASCKLVLPKPQRYTHMDLSFSDNCLLSGFMFNAGAGDWDSWLIAQHGKWLVSLAIHSTVF